MRRADKQDRTVAGDTGTEFSPPPPGNQGRRSWAKTWRSAVRGVGPSVVMWGGLLIIWELSTRFALISSYILPSPWSILEALVEFFPYLLDNSQVTLVETLVGFALGVLGGLVLAIGIGYSDFLRRGLYPMLVAFQAVPKVAIAPVLTVWFGIGLMSKFMMAFFIAFFPIVVNALSGLTDVPTNMVELVQVMRASKPTLFWKIRVPHALPAILDGCKIALPLAIIGAIIGEFVGSEEGLGNVILITSSQLNMALLFAALLVLTVLSLILFAILMWADRKIAWWRGL